MATTLRNNFCDLNMFINENENDIFAIEVEDLLDWKIGKWNFDEEFPVEWNLFRNFRNPQKLLNLAFAKVVCDWTSYEPFLEMYNMGFPRFVHYPMMIDEVQGPEFPLNFYIEYVDDFDDTLELYALLSYLEKMRYSLSRREYTFQFKLNSSKRLECEQSFGAPVEWMFDRSVEGKKEMIRYVYSEQIFKDLVRLLICKNLADFRRLELLTQGIEPNPGPTFPNWIVQEMVTGHDWIKYPILPRDQFDKVLRFVPTHQKFEFELYPDFDIVLYFVADFDKHMLSLYAKALLEQWERPIDKKLRIMCVMPRILYFWYLKIHSQNCDPRKIIAMLLERAGVEMNPGPFYLNGNTKREGKRKNVHERKKTKSDLCPQQRQVLEDLRNVSGVAIGNKYETIEHLEDYVERRSIMKFKQQIKIDLNMSTEMKTELDSKFERLEHLVGAAVGNIHESVSNLSHVKVDVNLKNKDNFLSFITETIAFVISMFAASSWTQVAAISYLYFSSRDISRSMIGKFLENLKNRLTVFKQQSGGTSDREGGFFETLFYCLDFTLLKRLPSFSDFTKFFSTAFFIERGFTSVVSLSDKIVMFIKNFINRASVYFLGKKMFEVVEGDTFDEWLTKTEELLNPAKDANPDRDIDIDEVGQHLKLGYELQKIVKGRKQEDLFKLRLAALQTLSLKLSFKAVDAETVDVPFIIMLYGSSGLGKSTLIKSIAASCVASSTRIPYEEKLKILENLSKYIYHRNVETEFYDGLKYKQIVVVYDDAFQMVDSQVKSNPELMEIIRTGGTAPVLPHVAAVDQKGRFNLHFHFIILTSNSPMPHPLESVSHPEAVYRRLNNFRFKVTEEDGETMFRRMTWEGNNFEIPIAEHRTREEFLTELETAVPVWESNQKEVRKNTETEISVIRERLLMRHRDAGVVIHEQPIEHPLEGAIRMRVNQHVGLTRSEATDDLTSLDRERRYFDFEPFRKFFEWYLQNPDDSSCVDAHIERAIDIACGRCSDIPANARLNHVQYVLTRREDPGGKMSEMIRSLKAYKTFDSSLMWKLKQDILKEKENYAQKLRELSVENPLIYNVLIFGSGLVGLSVTALAGFGLFKMMKNWIIPMVRKFSTWLAKLFGFGGEGVRYRDFDWIWNGDVLYACPKRYVYDSAPHLREQMYRADQYFDKHSYQQILYCLMLSGDVKAKSVPVSVRVLQVMKKLGLIDKTLNGQKLQLSVENQSEIGSVEIMDQDEKKSFVQESYVENVVITEQNREALKLKLNNMPEIAPLLGAFQEMYSKNVKREVQKGLPRFLQEACPDSQHGQSKDVVERNTYKILTSGTGTVSVLGMMVGVKKNYYLTFGHLMFNLAKKTSFPLQSLSGATVNVDVSNVRVVPLLNDDSILTMPGAMSVEDYCTWQTSNKAHSRDAVMLRIDCKDLPTVSSLESHVVRYMDLQKITNSSASMSLLRTPTGRDTHTLTEVTLRRDPVENEGDLGTFMTQNSFVYRCASVAGDCGAPLVLINQSQARKFFALHIGGSENMMAVGVSVYLELLEKAMDILDVMPMKFVQHCLFENKVALTDELPPNFGDGIFVQGIVHKPALQPLKTKLRHSEIHGLAFEPKMEPTHLRPYVKDGVIFDPLREGVKKYGGVHTPLDPVIEDVVKGVGEHLLVISPEKCENFKRVFSIEEAVFGIAGEASYGPLDRTTSPGYSWNSFLPGKTEFIRPGTETEQPWICDELRESVKDRVDKAKTGERKQTIYKDTLKDEKKKFGKKTRVFSNGQMDYNIAVRMYFGGFMLWFIKNCIYNKSLVGINMYERIVNVMAQTMKNRKIIAGDFENYDGTLRSDIGWYILNYIIEPFYVGSTLEERTVRRVLWFDLVNSMHICRDVLYFLTKSIPSGHPLTSIFNTIYNLVISVYCFVILAPRSWKTVKAYFDLVISFFYGDDNLKAVSAVVGTFFNYVNLQRIYRSLGHFYTDSSHANFDESKGFDNLEDVTILKRYINFDENLGIYVARLEKLTIEEMSNWVTKNGDPYSLMMDNIHTTLREASLWDQTYYEEVGRVLNEALICAGRKPIPIEPYMLMKQSVLQ